MRHTSLALLALLCACADDDGGAVDAMTPPADAGPPDSAGWFELVGESDLGGRGMNSAIAIVGDTAYIGSRHDGVTHANAGVLIVDISDPSTPVEVGAIGAPDQDLIGMSSRELRAVPEQHLLIVLNLQCSVELHGCGRDANMFPQNAGTAETVNLKFYDVSAPHAPVLVATHAWPFSNVTYPHEFFLWRDPLQPGRVLLYVTTPLGPPELEVLDISDPAAGITQVATFDAPFLTDTFMFPRAANLLHSLSVSDDGTRAYLAHLGAGLLVLDTSQVASGAAAPVITMLTPTAARVEYQDTQTHSAVKIPGREVVLMTDEIYEYPYGAGCPWGWVHLADVSDPAAPVLLGEHKLPQQEVGTGPGCTPTTDPGFPQPNFTAHNPTLTEHLALVTWHAGGLVVLDTSDPAAPVRLGEFVPAPRASVTTEDPFLGDAPVAMWSYPIIVDGLIYVVDIRNGLYVLRYRGLHEAEVSGRGFAEGNSNLTGGGK